MQGFSIQPDPFGGNCTNDFLRGDFLIAVCSQSL